MTTFDSHANLTIGVVATAPSPASSGTSVILQAGQGSLFPAAPFNCTVWPIAGTPTAANSEIVRVSGKSGDTLTIARAQEGSALRAILVGDQIAVTLTAKSLTDIESAVNALPAAPLTSFQGRATQAATLSKADVTGTGLAAADVGADASGAATAAQAAAIAASAQRASNLSDLASAATARTNLGLGSAATLASTAVAQTANNLGDLADSDSSRANLRVPVLRECKACSTVNVASLSGTTTIDTIALSAGDRVLLTGQTTGTQNGPWVVQAGAWVRPNDYATGATFISRMCPVPAGSANSGVYQLKSSVTVTVDTTATTWASVSGVSVSSVFVQHNTPSPNQPPSLTSSGRTWCGFGLANKTVAGGSNRGWLYNAAGLTQADNAITSPGSLNAKTLPANITTTGLLKVVEWPAQGKMYLAAINTLNGLLEVYSAPLVSGATQPTWTGPLLQGQANATLIGTAMTLTSVGLFIGEYTGGANNWQLSPPYSGANDITAGPKLYLCTDGSTFSSVLGPLAHSGTAGTRHFHGIEENPNNLGEIWASVGDQASPFYAYVSTDGAGAVWNGVAALNSSVGGGNNVWQFVSQGFGFGPNKDIIFGSDQSWGAGPFMLSSRTDPNPRWATTRTHYANLPPRAGVGGRRITDGVTTSNTTLTSASAAFTSQDVGKFLYASGGGLSPGTFVQAFVNATTVTMSAPALNSTSSNVITIGPDEFYKGAYAGCIDPTTGFWYFAANDATVGGTMSAIFCVAGPGKDIVVIQELPPQYSPGNVQMFVISGKIYYGIYTGIPCLTAITAEL